MSVWDPKEILDSIGLGKRTEVKRATRVADAIRKELAVLLLEKIRDPKLQDVGISRVTATDDLTIVKVYYTIYGPHKHVKAVDKAFLAATGFIRSHLARTLNMRYTPNLQFCYDKTAEKVAEIENIFQEIAKERQDNGENS